MKKPYSLDYSIEYDVDRCKAIYDILDKLDTTPSRTELEQMASYILYGKDPNGQNAVQRGEVVADDKRYDSFKTTDEKLLSLDELLEKPTTDQQEFSPALKRSVYKKPRPTIVKPKYNRKTGELIDPGDSDIPGMQQLWDDIARIEHAVAIYEGKIPPDETIADPIINDYRLYQLKHQLIDMRRHQYYLKDMFKPTIHFATMEHPKPQYFDYTCDSYYWITEEEWARKLAKTYSLRVSHDLKDYETRTLPDGTLQIKWVVYRHTFDWENPTHVKFLITYYDQLYDQLHEKLDTDGNTFFFDMERYRAMAGLSEVRDYILNLKLARFPYTEIVFNLQKKYGIVYTENYLCTILSKEIPEKIAAAAKRYRLLIETPPEERKQCAICGRTLPKDKLFFCLNKGRKDGFSSTCKECEKQKRIRGGQSKYDKRNKDSTLYEMQTRKTGE